MQLFIYLHGQNGLDKHKNKYSTVATILLLRDLWIRLKKSLALITWCFKWLFVFKCLIPTPTYWLMTNVHHIIHIIYLLFTLHLLYVLHCNFCIELSASPSSKSKFPGNVESLYSKSKCWNKKLKMNNLIERNKLTKGTYVSYFCKFVKGRPGYFWHASYWKKLGEL